MSQAPGLSKRINLEIEVKLACDDLDRLNRAGFQLILETPRHFEDNWLLDLPDQTLMKGGAALRIRSVNGKGTLTYKKVVDGSRATRLKVREEIETQIQEPQRVIELFERLGYRRSFRYQKYRTVYRLETEGQTLEVVFDETPIGNFVEIEGDERAVERVLDAAGFTAEESIQLSYPELQAERCRKKGIAFQDLVWKTDDH
ncbi:MAG TPA: class IV adenylate cyclase [Blastocatellia bacterium]|nr:class IV adenylate cyclase [Blastocatellia bacterium]